MIKKWILKAIVQKTISVLPFSFKINYFFQKHISKAMILSDVFLEDILRHFHLMTNERLKLNKESFKGKQILELGTGWHPIAPLCFFLYGADEIATVDLRNHIRKENIITLIKVLKEYKEALNLIERALLLDTTGNVEEILEKLHIKQYIGDITQLNMEKDHFNFAFSINVLEHIYESILEGVMLEIFKLTKQEGYNYHSLGCYDHFNHFDDTISKFNYLRYSEKQWKRVSNDIQPQNRLRVNYFENLYKKLGFQIESNINSEPNHAELDRLDHIHEDFSSIPRDILAVDYGTHILRKPLS
jgi:hypothetical protein